MCYSMPRNRLWSWICNTIKFVDPKAENSSISSHFLVFSTSATSVPIILKIKATGDFSELDSTFHIS